MPDARDHSLLTVLFAIAGGISASIHYELKYVAIAVVCMLLGDLFLSPDLDANVGSRAYRLWGPLRFIWWPYKTYIPHRSAVSHYPVIGTAGRLLYLGLLGYLVSMIAGHDLIAVLSAFQPETIAALAGFEAANSLHYLADRYA
jgi:uncharacterized metal-binding protein